MSCMLIVASALACTRDNPAFDEDEGGTFAGDTGTGTSDADTGMVGECEYEPGQGLTINLPMPCGETNPQTHRYERTFSVVDPTATGWTGYLCDIGDSDCSNCPDNLNPQAIELGPFELTSQPSTGACLWIVAAQAVPNPQSCKFDAIGIWYAGAPIVMASNGAVVVGEALDDAGQIVPLPVPAETPPCECIDACCVVTPGDYQFDVEGQKIAVGNSDKLASHPYTFHSLRAFNPTGCMDDVEQVWAMTYSPP